ncbi:MAG: hypothetical protein WC184_05335 [Acidimicrobiia bacterium]
MKRSKKSSQAPSNDEAPDGGSSRSVMKGISPWAVLSVVALCISLAACSNNSSDSESNANGASTVLEESSSETPDSPGGTVVAIGGELDGLSVTTGPLVESSADEAWLTHELRFQNQSNATIFLDDTKAATVADGKNSQIIVAFPGCGYSMSGGGVGASCLDFYSPYEIAPGEVVSMEIVLYKDLPGLRPFEPDTFGVPHLVRFRSDYPFEPNDGGLSSEAEIILEYEFSA